MGDTSSGTIKENRRNDQSKSTDIVDVSIVPLKGLKEDADADIPENYVTLSGTVRGYINDNGVNVWSSNPCANGHNYRNGSCITCGASDPNWVAPDVNVTTQPTTQPVIQPTTGTPGAGGESEETFSVLTIVLLAILAGGVVMLNVLLVGNMMGKRKK
jgi:hypothetical protein